MVEKGSNKRRSTGPTGRTDAPGTPQHRRPKHPAYFIPELAHVVALCDERIPFVTLAQEVKIYDFRLLYLLGITGATISGSYLFHFLSFHGIR